MPPAELNQFVNRVGCIIRALSCQNFSSLLSIYAFPCSVLNFSIFILSVFANWVLLWTLIPVLRAHLLDRPNARSSHRQPTPLGGGVSFVFVASAIQRISGKYRQGVIPRGWWQRSKKNYQDSKRINGYQTPTVYKPSKLVAKITSK